MAKRNEDAPPKGSPAWMSTFSDLMNLLLCFFVLLFSMSTVDAEKLEMVIASFQKNFSVLSGSGDTVGQGVLISSGISVMKDFDEYFNTAFDVNGESGEAIGQIGEVGKKPDENIGETNPNGDMSGAPEDANSSSQSTVSADQLSQEEISEAYEEQTLYESEKMAQEIEELAKLYGIQDNVEIEFNGQYVELTISGALLFNSGSATIDSGAYMIMDRIGMILNNYQHNLIEIEGHTDNVPMHSARFENNEVLSMYRAMCVADYFREHTDIPSANIKSSGRADYAPVADNDSPEGRAKNRRVEIKIYNISNSKGAQ